MVRCRHNKQRTYTQYIRQTKLTLSRHQLRCIAKICLKTHDYWGYRPCQLCGDALLGSADVRAALLHVTAPGLGRTEVEPVDGGCRCWPGWFCWCHCWCSCCGRGSCRSFNCCSRCTAHASQRDPQNLLFVRRGYFPHAGDTKTLHSIPAITQQAIIQNQKREQDLLERPRTAYALARSTRRIHTSSHPTPQGDGNSEGDK